MPLPDAKPDRRIYELLKTTDLESLTFSDFQKVAQTIYAEQGAEDELRRIVLVNLARLSVAGEWTGLTTAGGGGGGQTLLSSTLVNGAGTSYNTTYNVSGTIARATGASASFINGVYLVPFVAPRSASLASMTVDVSSANGTVDVGFYNTADDGGVGTLIGKATIDTSSTGLRTQSSLSATITLEKGSTYWMGYTISSGSSPTVWSANDGYAPLGVDYNNINNGANGLYYVPTIGSATSLPSGPFTSASDFRTSSFTYIPIIGLLWS